MTYSILDRINSPKDIKSLKIEELPQLCEEIRCFLLDTLSRKPGHLGAGLGVVELTVALHYVFDTPKDKLVWDVGHQAYPHKVLTGRKEGFETLRQWGGMSGFPTPEESEYDTFVAGHASNSISAALGMAVANRKLGRKDKVVAIIGDGSMTGGLAYEGINNVSNSPNDLLIVLNDNNMSIDPSTGGLSKYLVDVITNKTYNKVRNDAYLKLKEVNLIDERRRRKLLKFNNSIKSLFSDHRNLFEGFSIRYFGPVDGHDVEYLIRILRDIKDFEGPKMLHIITKKGKGYKPAEESQIVFHAPGLFDKESGTIIRPIKNGPEPPKFQDVFGETLVELAEMDNKIVGVTPAMPTGCSMTFLQAKHPEKVFDVGIAEGHAVTFSAGLAVSGMIPFCNVYSTFLQRGYDSVIHDVAMQSAPVIFCLDRAGLVGEDGMTHQGVYDIAYLRCIPKLTICSPYSEEELRNLMYTAYKNVNKGPFVIRYPRGKGYNIHWHNELKEIPIGKGNKISDGEKVAIVSYGPIGNEAAAAIKSLKEKGIRPAHYNLRFVKPLDTDLLREVFTNYEAVITLEDGVVNGGMGSALLEWMMDNVPYKSHVPVKRLGVPDEFIEHGAVQKQRAYCKIDQRGIEEAIVEVFDALNSSED